MASFQRGEQPTEIPLHPPVVGMVELSESLLGVFGPAVITLQDGALFRGENEFYPISEGRYYIPASGSIMRFRRDENGSVDALISWRAGGSESLFVRQEQ